MESNLGVLWERLLRQKSEHWIYARLSDAQTPRRNVETSIAPDTSYLSAFLRCARIVNVRKGLTRFYGVVHSTMHLPQLSGDDATFSIVTVPPSLIDIAAHRVNKIIHLNHRLLGPIPYVGGDLRLEIVLLSIASSNLAASYLQLLEVLSRKVGVAYFSTAVSLADTIIDGVNILCGGTSESVLEIGVTDTQAQPQTGYYVVVRASSEQVDVDKLSIDPNDGCLLENGMLLTAFPYIVFEITSNPSREDWFRIPELAEAYESIQKEFRRGRSRETRLAIAMFERVALTCNGLLSADAERLVREVTAFYSKSEHSQTAGKRSGRSTALPSLSKFHPFKVPRTP